MKTPTGPAAPGNRAATSHPRGLRSAIAYRALEPRIAFDGAAAETAVEAMAASIEGADGDTDAAHEAQPDLPQIAAAPAIASTPTDGLGPGGDLALDDSAASLADLLAGSADGAAAEPGATGATVVFVDSDVDDLDTLVAGIDPDFEIVLLGRGQSGLAQIATALEGRSDVASIHIVSHGEAGRLHLGTDTLSDATLHQHDGTLAAIGRSLQADGDILIYGCDVAAGEDGQRLIGRIAEITGADVAASSDQTGFAVFGGDWVLEVTAGDVDAGIAFSEAAQSTWQHTLASASFQEGTSGYAGTQDTMVDRLNPGTGYGASTTLLVNDGSPNDRNILIRFDSIVGSGAGQIPTGAVITHAELRVYVTNTDAADSVQIHRMLTTWSESSTYTSLSSGVSTNGVEAASTATASISSGNSGTQVFNVTADVQAWASGATNNGWVIVTGSSSADDWGFSSSENGTVGTRPLLYVTYAAPPIVDLDANNSSGASGSNFNRTFTEGSGAVTIADADATITDADSSNLTGMTVTLSTIPDGSAEVLAATTTGTSITASYNSGTGTLTLSGTDTVANYQQVLRTIAYNNTAADPTGGTRTITVTTTDGSTTSAAATTTLTMNLAPNDLQARPGISATTILGDYNFTSTVGSSRDDDASANPITWSGSPSVTTGQSGQPGAIDLTGGASGPYGDIVGLTTGGAMTIAATVRFDSSTNWARIVDFGQAFSQGVGNIYVGREDATNNLTFTIETNNGTLATYRATALNSIVNGQWLHFAATVDASGNMALYVNGTLAASGTGIVLATAVRDNNYIGRSHWESNGDTRFDGAVDNLLILNTALGAADVARLYQQNGFTVAENSANGTVIGAVTATDGDATASYTYALTNSAGGRFAISANGTITVADGSLLDFETTTSHTITVQVTDQNGLSHTESFTVSVTNANDAPVDGNETNTVTEDVTLTVADGAAGDLLNNANDADGNPLTITAFSVASQAGPFVVGTPYLISGVGTLTINANGSYAFAPAANYSGAVPVVSYTVSDGQGGTDTSTLTLSVTAVNDAPYARVPYGDIDGVAGEPISIPVHTQFADPDGNPLTFTVTGLPAGLAYNSGTGLITGTLPADAATAGPYTVTITASDGNGGTHAEVFTISGHTPTIGTHNGSWTAAGSGASTTLSNGITVTVSTTASGGAVIDSFANETLNSVPVFGDDAEQGTVSLQTRMLWDTTPGTATEAASLDAGSGTITLTFSAPVTNPLLMLDRLGGYGNFIANSLMLTLQTPGITLEEVAGNKHFVVDETSGTISRTVGTVLNGTAGIDSTIDPLEGTAAGAVRLNGTFTSVTFLVTAAPGSVEGSGGDTIELAFRVNAAPVADNETASVPEDQTLVVNAASGVLAGDTDGDGHALTVTQFAVSGVAGTFTAGSTATIAGVGALTIHADGGYMFVPVAGYNGPVPVATYTVSDGALASTGTLTISVTAANDRPAVDLDGSSGTTYTGAVGWFYNSPQGTLNGDITSSQVISAAAESVGAGLVRVADFTRVQISGASTTTYAGAVAANDYLQFGFTTAASVDADDLLSLVTMADWGDSAAYKVAIEISADNFATRTTLVSDYQAVVPGGGAYETTSSDIADFSLAASTTYAVRVYFYDAGATTVRFDDLQLHFSQSERSYAATYTENGSAVALADPAAHALDYGENDITLLNVNVSDLFAGGAAEVISCGSSSIPHGTPLNALVTFGGTTFIVDYDGDASLSFGNNSGPTIPVADLNLLIAALRYSNTSDAPIAGTRDITLSVVDSSGATSLVATSSVTVVAVNDAPVLGSLTGSTAAYTEGGGFVALDTDVSILDAELSPATFNGATLTLARNGGASAEDQLVFDGITVTVSGANVYVGGVLVGTYTFTGGQMDIAFGSGATQARVETLMRNILYANASDTPPASVVIGWTFSDGNSGAQGTGGALTASGSTTVTITAANDAPAGTLPATFTTTEDTALGLTGLSISDIDAASGVVRVTLAVGFGTLSAASGGGVTAGGSGTATLTLDGTVSAINAYLAGSSRPTFTPAANATGSVTLTMTTTDNGNTGVGGSLSDTDTATISITPVDDPTVLDLDDDGTTANRDFALSYSEGDGPVLLVAGNASVLDVEDHSIATVTLTFAGGDIGLDERLTIAGLTFDPFVNSGLVGRSGPGSTAVEVYVYGNGVVEIVGADSSLPPAQFSSHLRSIYYEVLGEVPGAASRTISMIADSSNTAVVTISLNPANDAPVDGDESNTATEDTTLTVPAGTGLLANATDVDGNPLTVSAFSVAGEAGPFVVGAPYAIAGVGTLTVNADGSYSFAPAADYTGAVPVVSYTVSDGAGGTDTATLTLSVTPVNDAPVAITDTGSTDENTVLTVSTGGGALVNDSDIDGNILTVSAVNGVLADVGRPVAGTGGGTFTLAADGSYDFDPGTAFDDLAPGAWRTSSIAYTISDGNGGTATATLTVTVIGRNDPVAAADDGATTDEDTSVVTGSLAGLLANDLDVDGDPLTVSAVGGSPSGVGSLVAGSSGGTFAIAADGSYVFTPGGDFDDLAPGQSRTTSVVYTVRDAAGAEATATLTITVMGTNDAPELGPIVAPPALDGAAVNFDVSGFASDPDDGSLTFAAAGLPPGLAMDAATGRITGVLPHDASLGTPYSVTVTVTDGQGGSATRTFSWPVGNPAPVAGDDTAGTREDVPVRIQVLANDYDPDGDTLTVAAATAERGTVTIHTDGTLGYVPAPAFSGVDLITYTISDGNGGTATATIRVSVEARTLVLLDEVFGFDGDTLATDIEFSGGTEADGAVLDAVREAGDLSSIAGTLDADGAVLAAANGVRSLGGIGSFGELDPDVVADMLSSLRHAELDQLSIGGRSGDPREAEGHGGFSLKAAFDGQRQGGSIQGALVVESLVRDRTLMLQLSSTASLGGKSVVEYRVTRTDGSPVPPWLGRAGPDLLIGERPADLETIELRIEGICSDGSRVVQDVHIDVTTGEIKPLKPLQHGEAAPLLFRDQLYADRELSPDEIERLAEAIMAFRAA